MRKLIDHELKAPAADTVANRSLSLDRAHPTNITENSPQSQDQERIAEPLQVIPNKLKKKHPSQIYRFPKSSLYLESIQEIKGSTEIPIFFMHGFNPIHRKLSLDPSLKPAFKELKTLFPRSSIYAIKYSSHTLQPNVPPTSQLAMDLRNLFADQYPTSPSFKCEKFHLMVHSHGGVVFSHALPKPDEKNDALVNTMLTRLKYVICMGVPFAGTPRAETFLGRWYAGRHNQLKELVTNDTVPVQAQPVLNIFNNKTLLNDKIHIVAADSDPTVPINSAFDCISSIIPPEQMYRLKDSKYNHTNITVAGAKVLYGLAKNKLYGYILTSIDTRPYMFDSAGRSAVPAAAFGIVAPHDLDLEENSLVPKAAAVLPDTVVTHDSSVESLPGDHAEPISSINVRVAATPEHADPTNVVRKSAARDMRKILRQAFPASKGSKGKDRERGGQ